MQHKTRDYILLKFVTLEMRPFNHVVHVPYIFLNSYITISPGCLKAKQPSLRTFRMLINTWMAFHFLDQDMMIKL